MARAAACGVAGPPVEKCYRPARGRRKLEAAAILSMQDLTPLRIVIVDRERLGRLELRRLLEALPGTAVVGEAASALDGADLVGSLRPDVVFLEAQSADGTGAARLQDATSTTLLLLVTADEGEIPPVWRRRAAAVLSKPVSPRRLGTILQRWQRPPE